MRSLRQKELKLMPAGERLPGVAGPSTGRDEAPVRKEDGPGRARRFILLCANFGGNLGDRLIFDNTVAWLRSAWPGCEIVVSPLAGREGTAENRDLMAGNYDVTIAEPFGATCRPHAFFQACCPPAAGRILGPMLFHKLSRRAAASALARWFHGADAVFAIGGNWSGFSQIMVVLSLLDAALQARSQVAVLPVSLPVNMPAGLQSVFPGIVAKTGAFAVRDPASLRIARSLGIRHAALFPDMAFAVPCPAPAPRRASRCIRIGICLRISRERIRPEDLARVAGALAGLRRDDCSITVFTSHERDDAESIRRLREAAFEFDVVTPESVNELFDLVSDFDLVVSDRLHALIVSTLVGTPIVPVMSLPKVTGYVEYIGYPLSVPDFIDLRWDRHIAPAVAKRNELREHLAAFAADACRELRNLGKHVGKCMDLPAGDS